MERRRIEMMIGSVTKNIEQYQVRVKSLEVISPSKCKSAKSIVSSRNCWFWRTQDTPGSSLSTIICELWIRSTKTVKQSCPCIWSLEQMNTLKSKQHTHQRSEARKTYRWKDQILLDHNVPWEWSERKRDVSNDADLQHELREVMSPRCSWVRRFFKWWPRRSSEGIPRAIATKPRGMVRDKPTMETICLFLTTSLEVCDESTTSRENWKSRSSRTI